MGHGGKRVGAGRPRKYAYATVAEYRAVRREQDRLRRERQRREQPTRYFEPQETPPPAEVILERQHREELRKAHRTYELPPPTYSAQYYVKAWRIQRRLARGQSVGANQ